MSTAFNLRCLHVLGAVAMAIAVAELGLLGCAQSTRTAASQLPSEGELPSLGSASAWLNSPPLTAAGLRGHLVLVDFWTYTCINWLRTLPYVRAWGDKYKEQGLVVV